MCNIPLSILIWIALFTNVSSQSCLFGFERDEELGDFNTTCGDMSPNWLIVNRPESPEAPVGAGFRVLTTPIDKSMCMITKKPIEMRNIQGIAVIVYVKRLTEANAADLTVSLVCPPSPISSWKSLEKQGLAPAGTWQSFYQIFFLEETSCHIQIEMFHSGDYDVYLDQIIIDQPLSSSVDCYTVPRPPSTTTEEDSGVTDPATSGESTTQTDDAVTDPNTDETTDSSNSTPDDITGPSTTNSDQNSTIDDGTRNTGTTSEGFESKPTSEEPSTDSGGVTNILPTEGSPYPVFSMFYMVTIIAVLTSLPLLSLALCCWILLCHRRSHKRRNEKSQQLKYYSLRD